MSGTVQDMENIYREHAQTVYRYLLARTHDAALAEELTQETFYQAVRSAGRFTGECKITTWLCGIARNVLRTERRRIPEEALAEPIPAGETADGVLLAGEERVELLRRMQSLGSDVREVMYLRIFGTLSFREIGDILSRSENWARVTYYRGKERLRKDMENDNEK